MINKLLTISVATFNSEKRLPFLYKSIQKQIFDKNCLQVIIVDGNSTDKTTLLAKKYGWQVINNPKFDPVSAKFIAYKNSKTKYLMFLDHDEIFSSKFALKSVVDSFKENLKIKAVITTGYKNPKKLSSLNRYVSEYGDPFSCFFYRFSKDSEFCLPTMKKHYQLIKETKNVAVFDFSKKSFLPIIELVAAGSTIDLNYFRKTFPQTKINKNHLTHLFYLMIKKNKYLGISKNSILFHYSAENIKKYLPKLHWRIKNNIFYKDKIGLSGFYGRNNFNYNLLIKNKKFFFIPYSLLILPALCDSIYLAIKHKDFFYVLHSVLSFYTATLILFYYFLKIIGINLDAVLYDGTKIEKASKKSY